MSATREFLQYVAVGAGMAVATCSLTVAAGMFGISTGIWTVASIVLGGLGCMVVATSVAELASMYPTSAGIRTYLKVAFGDTVSLIFVNLYLAFLILVAGVECYVFALVVQATFPGVPVAAVIAGLVGFVVVMNLLGLEIPLSAQLLLTAALLGSILALGAFGVLTPGAEAAAASPGAVSGGLDHLKLLPASVGMAVFLFIGFEWVIPVGRNREAYGRLIPRAMPVSIACNIAVYAVFTLGLSHQLSRGAIVATSVPQVDLARVLLGPGGVYLALGMSVLAIVSTFNAGLMGGARLLYALAREGTVPRICARISLRTGAPVGAVFTLTALATLSSVAVVVWELQLLAAVVGTALICCVYAALLAAALHLRRKMPARKRAFRTPVHPWVQGGLASLFPLFGLGSLVSQAEMPFAPGVLALGLLALALVMVTWAHRSRRRREACNEP